MQFLRWGQTPRSPASFRTFLFSGVGSYEVVLAKRLLVAGRRRALVGHAVRPLLA